MRMRAIEGGADEQGGVNGGKGWPWLLAGKIPCRYPIRRGNTFQITWTSTPGLYQVRIFSASGALVQVREVEVSSLIQTYTWEVPGNWAAGVYIIQVIRPGQAETLAQKVMIE